MHCDSCGAALDADSVYCGMCGKRVMPWTLPRQGERRYAGFWLRVAAWIFDSAIITAGTFVLLALLILFFFAVGVGLPSSLYAPLALIAYTGFLLLVFIGEWLYFCLCESSEQRATPGKRAVGIRVTTLEGRRVSFGRATGRHFGKILSGLLLGIGYLVAAFTEKKQALHDIMADCVIVKD